MYNKNSLVNYRDLLEKFLLKGYQFVFFKELDSPINQVVMRHDIDFDCSLALELAKIESDLNIQSTYFFLLSNDAYNIVSPSNFKSILEIKKLGHQVSLHFDPLIYDDFEKGFEMERGSFESLFATKLEIISLHRPNTFFQNYNRTIKGVEHTYMEKYFKKIKYFSDSTGIWRFGHPFNSPEFRANHSLHILVHPVWWLTSGQGNVEKINKHYHMKVNRIKDHFRTSCKTFKL
jgi:hypothetical protein